MMCGLFAVTALLLEDRQSRLEQEGEEDRWDMTYDAASPLPFGDETRVRTSLILARRNLLNETGMLDSVTSPHRPIGLSNDDRFRVPCHERFVIEDLSVLRVMPKS